MTKEDIFQELLDEWQTLNEDKVDRSYSGAAWEYQKITNKYKEWEKRYKEAEKVDLGNVVVEHFTREEYKNLIWALNRAIDHDDTTPYETIKLDELKDKLTKILEEEK